MIIKIADFGLSVNIGAKEYYRLTKHVDVKLPVKWMAPESLADYMFSEMSDVVSDLIKRFTVADITNYIILRDLYNINSPSQGIKSYMATLVPG